MCSSGQEEIITRPVEKFPNLKIKKVKTNIFVNIYIILAITKYMILLLPTYFIHYNTKYKAPIWGKDII